MAVAAINVDGLAVNYGDTPALAGVSSNVEQGSVIGILGPNGAGKTTLIRVLATQRPPSEGSVVVAGYDVVARRREVQRRIGLTGQFAALDDDLTATENLRFVAALAGVPRAVATEQIAMLLDRFGLVDIGNQRLAHLSGGTRRRVDLAASLVASPQVVVLDEPTTGLDPQARAQLWELVAELATDGVTIVLTTQYLDEADRLADRILLLDRGRLVAEGTPAEIKARIGGQIVTATMSNGNDIDRVGDALGGLSTRVSTDPRNSRLTAHAADASNALEIAAALQRLAVPINEFTVIAPTLDDAFQQLTTI